MTQEFQENEEQGTEEQTGEQPQTKRGRGWPKGKARKPVPDVSLASSVDGRESDGYVYDAEAGELQTPKGKGLKLPPNLLQIAAIALIVSLVVVVIMTSVISPTVSRKQYSSDIGTLVTDIQNLRGSGYTSAMTVAGISKQYDTLNTRSNSFLVNGDLSGYATDSDLSSQISSLRSSIPSATDLANQASTQVNAKLATVDTKIAAVDTTVGNLTARVNAALATLGNSTSESLTYSLAVSGFDTTATGSYGAPIYLLTVKSNTSGIYAARVIIDYSNLGFPRTYSTVSLGNATHPISYYDVDVATGEFYRSIATSVNPYYPSIVCTVNRNYVPTMVWDSINNRWKLSSIQFYSDSFSLTTNVAATFAMPISGLQNFNVYSNSAMPRIYIEIVKGASTTTTTSSSGI